MNIKVSSLFTNFQIHTLPSTELAKHKLEVKREKRLKMSQEKLARKLEESEEIENQDIGERQQCVESQEEVEIEWKKTKVIVGKECRRQGPF